MQIKKSVHAVVVIITLILFSCNEKKDENIKKEKGEISLEYYNLHDLIIPLDTQWEFYFEKLYTPSDFLVKQPVKTGFINVPGTWNGYETGEKILSGDGYATYRLTLKKVPAGYYAFKIPSMATAYRMWVNNLEVSSNGKVAENASMIPMQKPEVAFFDSDGGDIVIIINVSNYMSDKGGIWDTIYFGERYNILKKRYISICLEMALFGAFIIMSLYHFALYIFRKKNDFALYFGLVCFIIALRVIITGEFILVYFVPWIDWTLQIKTEFLTVFGGFTFFIIFLKKLYDNEFSAEIINFYIITGLLFSLASLILPVKISALMIPLYHMLIIAGFIIILKSLAAAVKNKKNGSLHILAGSIILIITLINDILDSNGLINSTYIFPYGLLLFIFSQSVILAKVFSESFSRVEDLSMQLGISYLQIDEYNKNLELKIAERTSELEAANEKLRELDRAKTDFFANISHELRTPLTLILSPVEDALSGKELESETLEMIHRNAMNLLSLINNLLEVSRITAGKMKLAVYETDICDLVKKRCGEMESAAKLKGINLLCNIPPDAVKAFVDRERSRHLLSNFFSNSFKFTEPGGSIEVSVAAEDNYCIIKFSDTGCGIPADKLGIIFDRFTQGDTSSTRKHEGTGIGLSIVKDLVTLHGGEISVKSWDMKYYPINHGTVFTVKIPSGKKHLEGRDYVEFINDEDSITPGKIISCVRGNFSGTSTEKRDVPALDEDALSILVVEDNDDLRQLLSEMLSNQYRVFEATNGEEATEFLEKNEDIDLVLSDIMMPGMNGHELICRIRTDKRFETLPFIFLTARADSFMKIEGLALGATDYVTKPFNSRELLLRISNQMEMKRLKNSVLKNYNKLIEKLKTVNLKPISKDNTIKIETICSFIKENFDQELLREDLAYAAGINPDTFSRLFNQYTGSTLNDYIQNLRIAEAMHQLSTTENTVTRISINTGFDNIRTFNRAFKKITGITPGEYRDKSRIKN